MPLCLSVCVFLDLPKRSKTCTFTTFASCFAISVLMSNVIVQPFVEVCGRFQLAGVLAELQMCPAGSCTTESYLFPVVSISQYSLGQGKALNSVLYEAYLNCGGNWTSSKLYLPITSTNSTRKAGKRKWMTRRELEERFGKDARWEGLEKHVGVGRLFFALSHLRTVPLTNSFGSVIPWQLAIDCTKCYKHRPVVDTCANDALSMEIWKISPMMLQVPSLKLTATAPETLGLVQMSFLLGFGPRTGANCQFQGVYMGARCTFLVPPPPLKSGTSVLPIGRDN